MLDSLERRTPDAEYIALLHNLHKEPIAGHNYRGYTLLLKGDEVLIGRESDSYFGTKRPVWFVFGGIGSQWSGMGKSFIQIPVFAAAIQKCDKVLRTWGVDIVKIITENDPKIFENILHSSVGIAAIQIGLVDIFKMLGIVPDHIIGYSIGELGCAYADGCFTAEEMILTAYTRGLANMEKELIQTQPSILTELQKVITPPIARSDKWISYPSPADNISSDLLTNSTAECNTNIFLSALRKIQANAIVIEIAPHGLLQPILCDSLPSTVVEIPLMQPEKNNNYNCLFQAIGK